MRWRSGSSSRSSCRRRSSLARSLSVRSSYWLRVAPSALSRSSLSASASCRPACAAASDRRPSSALGALVFLGERRGLLRRRLDRAAAARRGALPACAARTVASCAWRSRLRCCSRLAASARSASITRSSSWAWRSWLSASCMSSSSKRAFGGDAPFLQFLELRIDFAEVAGELLAARARLLGQLREAQRLDLQLVRARSAFRPLRGAPRPGAARHRRRRPRHAPARCAPLRLISAWARSWRSRFSISCWRASRPACSESCA